jgi:hypothetical protein
MRSRRRRVRPGATRGQLGCADAGHRFASGRIQAVRANLVLVKNISVIGVVWGAQTDRHPAWMSRTLAELLRWCEDRKLEPPSAKTFSLAEAGVALDALVGAVNRRLDRPWIEREHRLCLAWSSRTRFIATAMSLRGDGLEPLSGDIRTLDSNQSLATFEPVSVREREFRWEKVSRSQRRQRRFQRHKPIPGDRDRAFPRRLRQSRSKLKTIPTAPGNRNCAGLRGGAGRTQTDHQAIMSPKLIINGRRRAFAPRLGRQDCGPIDMAPPARAPSRWHRVDRSRQ